MIRSADRTNSNRAIRIQESLPNALSSSQAETPCCRNVGFGRIDHAARLSVRDDSERSLAIVGALRIGWRGPAISIADRNSAPLTSD